MSRRALTLVSAAILAVASSQIAACAPDTGLGEGEEAEDIASDISLTVVELPVTKSAAPEGLTVITKKADYVAFFGTQPPSNVNFQAHWVLHYSMGIENTGGYDANITAVERIGSGAGARLAIYLEEVSPGPGCFVTQALTNPQVTVRIPKQKKTIAIDQSLTETSTDCSEPNWCASALCGPGTTCDELSDSCVEEAFCPKVKCANGYECDESVDACVGRLCDPEAAPEDGMSCPSGFVCENQIVCITYPCPAQYRCEPAPEDPCQGIDWVGTCDGTTLKYCDNNQLVEVECSPYECGYNSSAEYFDCL
jgi:hypothetical protein